MPDQPTPDRAERHRAAQARYAASEKGRAKRKAYYDEYVHSGRKASVQARWSRRRADEREDALLADMPASMREAELHLRRRVLEAVVGREPPRGG